MSPKTPIRLAAAAAALLALGACGTVTPPFPGLAKREAGPATAPVSAPLAPARKPAAPLMGDLRAVNLLDGSTLTMRVRRSGDGVRVAQSDGCVWTRWGDWFAPSDSWANCDDSKHWSAGSATVRPIGSLWPLRPGAEARYRRDAVSHTGRTYSRETSCRVTGAEAVIRPSGEATPAHVVQCADGKRVRTTWWSNEEGPVAFRSVHAETGLEEAWVRQ